MKTLTIVLTIILLLCLSLSCEGDRGPMGPTGRQGPTGNEGPQGPPGEGVQIISIIGQINNSRYYGFFEIWNSIIRADDVVDVYVGPDTQIIAWASCEHAYGDGFALIYDPDYSLVGWYYLVRIVRNPADQ